MSRALSVLIIEGTPEIGQNWAQYLEEKGIRTITARDHKAATDILLENQFDIVVMDIVLQNGSSLAIADFVGFRYPDTRIIFVTNTSFFSDGSLFRLIPNACAYVKCEATAAELHAMVEHYVVKS